MLHLTNGDQAAKRIAAAGIEGDIVSWNDVLHEGPVPAGLDLDDLRPVRARFIADQGWGRFEQVLAELTDRDSALRSYRQHDEVVLWFEHDLYDQLQQLQILDWFSSRRTEAHRVNLVSASDYLGPMEETRLQALFARRRPVTERQLEIARRAWAAFRDPEPTAIERFLSGDLAPLPFLEPALRRHLEEFPDTGSGLSRSERQALEAFSGGARRLAEAFRAAHHEREDPVFLGDTVFLSYLMRLNRGTEPLIALEAGGNLAALAGALDRKTIWDRRAVLTEAGRAVLSGRRDWLEVQPIDRWLGGSHLRSEGPIWRWNAARRCLELRAS